MMLLVEEKKMKVRTTGVEAAARNIELSIPGIQTRPESCLLGSGRVTSVGS